MKINPKYKPLWSSQYPYRYAVLSGGRGSGKSFVKQTFLRDLTYEAGHKIADTRFTMVSAERSVIPEFQGKLSLAPSPYGGGDMSVDFDQVGRTFKNLKSESELFFIGLKTSSGMQTAALKSIEGLTTWAMEEAEEIPDDATEEEEGTFDKLDNSIRMKGPRLRVILAWNPSDVESFMFKRFFKEPGIPIDFNGYHEETKTLYIHTTYHDNAENLDQNFLDKAENIKKKNPARYEHIYMGKPIEANALALWKKTTMISPFRISKDEVPPLRRICVAVDPSVTSTGRQDECGIITAGEGINGDYYILRDDSGLMSPSEWGRMTAGVYHETGADKVVAEVNQGGDLVESNIKAYKENIPIKKVHATRGKVKRAEPIATLYEEGKVHHVGDYPELEGEMCSYVGDPKDDSPNRFDALVWVLTELAMNSTKGPRVRQL